MKAMRKKFTWGISLIAVGCALVIVVLIKMGFFRETSTNFRRDLEMQAHQKLVQLIRGGSVLTVFTSDGCSGGLSDAWRAISDQFPKFAKAHETNPPWEACCLVHDRAYHVAGGATEAQQSYDLRLAADNALRECVFSTRFERSTDLSKQYGLTEQQVRAAYSIIAKTMFEAVRIGGRPCSGLEWRWGYGYPRCSS
jgi:hypothetical protein